MNKAISRTFKIYKYLSLIFILSYVIYIVIDDYNFIINYWNTNWKDYLKIWSVYLFMYFVAFTIYFWIISIIIIFCYYKIYKRIKNNQSTKS